jgi:hypothetical protein
MKKGGKSLFGTCEKYTMTINPIDGSLTTIPALAQRVRTYLQRIAVGAKPITYKALADALTLTPPNTIHQVTQALEHLMGEDAANGRPFIAALVISRARSGLPGPGFFDVAQQVGRFDGDLSGPEPAAAFHGAEFAAAVTFWSSGEIPETAHRHT